MGRAVLGSTLMGFILKGGKPFRRRRLLPPTQGEGSAGRVTPGWVVTKGHGGTGGRGGCNREQQRTKGEGTEDP